MLDENPVIRSSCVRCGATLLRGVERGVGQVLLDAVPLTATEEAAVLIETVVTDGRRRRYTFDVVPRFAGSSIAAHLGVECQVRTELSTGRPGAVMVEHRCGRFPARRLPPAARPRPEVTGDDDSLPFDPYADRFTEGFDPNALSLLAIKSGSCPLCGNRKERKGERLCNKCRPFAHGAIYHQGEPVVGWCEVGRHRKRTAGKNGEGKWDCGTHAARKRK